MSDEPPIWEDTTHTNLQLVIDIENSFIAQNSIGYRKWAEKFNLEQLSQTLIFIEKYQLSLEDLENMATQKPLALYQIKDEIKDMEDNLNHISVLQRHIGSYGKTKDIYKQYIKSANPEQFRIENVTAITAYEEAKKYFDACGYTFDGSSDLPTIQELKVKYAKYNAHKGTLWQKYHDTRNSDIALVNAWGNVKTILNLDNEEEFVPYQPKMDVEEFAPKQPQAEISTPQKKVEISPVQSGVKIVPPENVIAPKPKVRKRSGPSL